MKVNEFYLVLCSKLLTLIYPQNSFLLHGRKAYSLEGFNQNCIGLFVVPSLYIQKFPY